MTDDDVLFEEYPPDPDDPYEDPDWDGQGIPPRLQQFQCRQCGKCCRTGLCGAAFQRFGQVKECPALTKREDGKYHCSLVAEADDETLFEIGIGDGECALPIVKLSLKVLEMKRKRAEKLVDKLLSDPSVSEAQLLAALGLREI